MQLGHMEHLTDGDSLGLALVLHLHMHLPYAKCLHHAIVSHVNPLAHNGMIGVKGISMAGHVLCGPRIHNPSEHVGLLSSSMCGKSEILLILHFGGLMCTLLALGLVGPTKPSNVA